MPPSKDSNAPLALLPTVTLFHPGNLKPRRALDACARFSEITTHDDNHNASHELTAPRI